MGTACYRHVCVWVWAIAGLSGVAGRDLVDGYAALVNDRVILRSDVDAFIAPLEARLRGVYEGGELQDELQRARTNGLNSLIERYLVVEEFETQEAEIPQRMVDDRIRAVIHERFDDDRLQLMQALAEQHLTMIEWEEQMKDQIIYSIMRRREMTHSAVVSPQDVRARYLEEPDRYRTPAGVELRVIALSAGTTPSEREVKRKQAETLRKKVMDGEDFGSLAVKASQGRKAREGGYWGWMDPRDLRGELAAVVRSLEAGRVSDVVETEETFYLLLVERRRPSAVVPFEKVREQLGAQMRREKEQQLYRDWIERLKKRHYVKVYGL
jgi:peptidyl-prolyl cis-trans isomerase SurA